MPRLSICSHLVFLTVLLGACGALAIVPIATGLSVSGPNQLPVR